VELRATGIGHAYGPVRAIEDLNFTASAGEILALIGPSGCGKSTLLGILGGLIAPTDGAVTIHGAPPPDCLNPLTYVFQDFALLPWQSARDNIGLVLDHHGLSQAERRHRVDEVLTRTGLVDFADAFPKQLSGGMRQRVGIARALVVRPAVLLMDEPLSALDAQTREILIDDILALWQRDRPTIVYVTHNLAEALRLAHRVVVLSRRPGRIREIVAVDVPHAERGGAAGLIALARLQDQLWQLIRDEAAAADREIIDG
jgi:NitT/TauT family transport system ATP-binding protein